MWQEGVSAQARGRAEAEEAEKPGQQLGFDIGDRETGAGGKVSSC